LNKQTQLFLLLLTFLVNIKCNSQEPIYKHYGVDEGLPSSQVYDIYQDLNGYIWFATDKGLSRYNGYEFENFDINDGLPGNVVIRFYPQQNGQIWCYTLHNQALFYFNKNFDGFIKYKHNNLLHNQLKPRSVIKSLFINKLNTIQLGGSGINGELLIEDGGKISRKYSKNSTNLLDKYIVLKHSSKEEVSYFLTSDAKYFRSNFSKLSKRGSSHIDALWLTPNEEAIFMDGDSVQIISKFNVGYTIKTNNLPLRIKAINNTQFFVGYYFGGVKIITNKGKILQEYLKDKSVTNFLVDNEGGYWFTTLNSGVYYIKKPLITIFNQLKKDTYSHIKSLAKKNNKLLIGYKNGNLAEITPHKVYNFYSEKDVVGASLIEYDSVFHKTYVYNNGNLKVNGKTVSFFYSIKLSEPSLSGTVFSSFPSGFYDINKNKRFSFPKRVQDICIWKKDTLIATPFGIFKKNKDAIIALSKESKLLGYRSDDIDLSKKRDCFYIATQGAGIVVYGKEIYNISTKDGLTSNIVNEIHVENDSTIWACTNKGLNKVVFKNSDFSITTIDKNAGLLSNEVEDVEIIKDTLWIGTKVGLCYMPKKVLENSKQPDSLYLRLKEVKVNDAIIPYNEGVKLNYNENKITFFIQGILYSNHNNLQYQYRIKEAGSEWNITKSRHISFPNLKYGKYTFQFRACIGNKYHSKEQLEYIFIIKPPFWKSKWFYSLCLIGFGGIIYLFFKIRVLTYNKDVVREFLRLLIKRLKRDEKYIEIRTNGEDIKIKTSEILFIKSSGNYLDILTTNKTYTIRCKIGDFIATTPDSLEYLRVHRSYIIRIDKVTGKSKKSVTLNDHIIPVGDTYLKELDKILF